MRAEDRSPRFRWIARVGLALLLLVSLALSALALAIGALWIGSGEPSHEEGVRLYTAGRIITLDPSRPFAEAIAVENGRILAVGRRTDVERALGNRPFVLDRRFEHRVLLPGFIDPHVHPLAAVIFDLEIVSAMQWPTPTGPSRAVRGREAFLARLAELAAADSDRKWLVVWGYHEPYHGRLGRADLDRVAGQRPVLVWQRSEHEMFFNTAALEELGFEQSEFAAQASADWATGHVWEAGLLALGDRIRPVLFSPTRFARGLRIMGETFRRGGLTTVAEQGFPQQAGLAEFLMLHFEMLGDETAYRWVLVPNATYLMREYGDAGSAERAARWMLRFSSDRVRIVRHLKYYADGAIFSQRMQMSRPYLDGHEGEWMTPPEEQRALLESFWPEGWSIHVHVNGDAGIDLVLDQIEAVQSRWPAAPGQRVVLEHYGYARPDQHARLRELGVEVSNNAYYVHELAPIYAGYGLGPERAADISPLGGLAQAGVRFSVHSDFPMAPAEPLRLVWAAVTRIGSDGHVWGPDQRVSLTLALRAITIEAARSLGLEDEIGSLEAGKRADFTILEADPYATPPEDLADIPIWGTVLGGRPWPAPR